LQDLVVFLPSPELTSLEELPLRLADIILLLPDTPLSSRQDFNRQKQNLPSLMIEVSHPEEGNGFFLLYTNGALSPFGQAIENICRSHLHLLNFPSFSLIS